MHTQFLLCTVRLILFIEFNILYFIIEKFPLCAFPWSLKFCSWAQCNYKSSQPLGLIFWCYLLTFLGKTPSFLGTSVHDAVVFTEDMFPLLGLSHPLTVVFHEFDRFPKQTLKILGSVQSSSFALIVSVIK